MHGFVAGIVMLDSETPRIPGDPGHAGALVLECSNLATFRSDVQRAIGVPVFDMVSLIESFADGYRQRTFAFPYRAGRGEGRASRDTRDG